MAVFPRGIINTLDQAQQAINNNNPLTPEEQFKTQGFLIPPTFSADGNGLPASKVPTYKEAQVKRNIITWFVPEFGTVRMYVNPSSIVYGHKKLISKVPTKGGYTLQYWGEELSTLTITGNTGSSGIEGINVLYEIYRAEQYAFDGIGLSLAANNAAADVSYNLIQGAGNLLGNAVGGLFGEGPIAGAAGAGILGGLLGLDSPNNTLSAKNIPSLAQLAFTVEMYYNGWVHRGFFDSFTVTERADNFLMDYSINFVVTQRRGYRQNQFPWQRSATNGPSSDTTPHSFSGHIKSGI